MSEEILLRPSIQSEKGIEINQICHISKAELISYHVTK